MSKQQHNAILPAPFVKAIRDVIIKIQRMENTQFMIK